MTYKITYRAYGENNKTIKENEISSPISRHAKTDEEILEVLEAVRSDVGGDAYDEEVLGVEIK